MDEKKTHKINEEDLTQVTGGTGDDGDYSEGYQPLEPYAREAIEIMKTKEHKRR